MISNPPLDSTTIAYLQTFEVEKDAIEAARKELIGRYAFRSLSNMTLAEKAQLAALNSRFVRAEAAHFAIWYNGLTDLTHEAYRMVPEERKPIVRNRRIAETERWMNEFKKANHHVQN